MARPDKGRKRTWRFRLDDSTMLEVHASRGATEKQVRRRGRIGLVLGTVIAAMMISAVAVASVSTDHQDYPPGSVVTISGDNSDGAGYLAGETVAVDVLGPNGYEAPCEAVADEDSAWSCQVTLWDSELAEGSYSYTATSLISGVSETGSFTDHGPSPVTDNNYSITANATHMLSLSVDLGGGSASSVTLTAATMKVANVTDGGTTDVVLTSPGTSTGNGAWTGSLQGACGKTYKINNVSVTWATTHDHTSTEVPDSGEGTDQLTTSACPPTNSAPVVTANDDSFDEGTSEVYSAVWTDANAGQTHTCTIDFGDGAGPQPAAVPEPQPSTAGTCTASHTYADGPNSYTIAVSVSDGTASGSDTATATVNNVPPTIDSVTNDGPVDEGSPATITVAASDPAGILDPLSYEFDCDDDSAYEIGPQSANSAHCTYPDGPSSNIVNVRVTDGDGGGDTDSTTVEVNNVNPTVAAPSFQITSIGCRTSVTLSRIGFNDPGADADWAVEIDWDDGSTTSYDTASKGVQPVQTHQYDTPGTYTALVTVTDKDGGVGSNTSSNNLVVNQTYTVDFLPPFDDSTPSGLIVNKMKNGRVVPVKATIYDDCTLSFVTDPTANVTIKTSKTSGTGTGDPIEEYADAGQSSAGTNEFRFADGFWIYNLDSKALGLAVNNMYRLDIYVGSVKATVANWAVLQPVK